jgi:hypothetical protein
MPSRTSPGAHVLLLLLLPLLLLVAGCATDTAEGAVSTGPIELVFGPAAGYSPVTDPLAAHLLREESASASAVIGPEGGSLELIGHRVRVPAGAVRGPTTFTISGRPGTVEVELEATAPASIGGVVNVGRRGFDRPVEVTLSYARTAFTHNPPGVDHLTLLRVFSRFGYDRFEPVTTRVDEETRTVTAELRHFSRYALASPY